MSVDVFGRTLIRAKEVHQDPAGIGFVLTKEGDFNIEKRRLCNVAPAVEAFDAITLENLKVIEENLKNLEKNFKIAEENIRKLAEGLIHVEIELAKIVDELRTLTNTTKI